MRIQGFDRDKDEFAFSQSARSFIGMYSFLILFIPISKARDLYVKEIINVILECYTCIILKNVV